MKTADNRDRGGQEQQRKGLMLGTSGTKDGGDFNKEIV